MDISRFPVAASVSGEVFSIIIPTWNNLDCLKLCIRSIRTNSALPHQIIVHVNEGSDGTIQWLRGQQGVDISWSRANIGVCYALNACRSLARTDFICYMNDDMYACPGWDKALHDTILELQPEEQTRFFISGTAIETVPQSNCSIQGDYGNKPSNFREEELLKNFARPKMHDWHGATWPPNVVHRDLWDLVGGYSTEFSPGMYSDPDFSKKLWDAGVRIFRGIGASRVYHFGSASVKRITHNKGYYQFISKWGMTSSTFSRYFLRRGEPWHGTHAEAALVPLTARVKNFFKRLSTAWLKR